MVPVTSPSAAGRARWLLREWRWSRVRRDAAFLLAGLPLQAAGPGVLALCWLAVIAVLRAVVGGDIGVVPLKPVTLLTGLVVAVTLVLSGVGVLTALQRRRFRRFLGVTIRPARSPGERLTAAMLARALTSRPGVADMGRGLTDAGRWAGRWRQFGYHLLLAPALGIAGLVALLLTPSVLAAWIYAGVHLVRQPHGAVKAAVTASVALIGGLALLAAARWLIRAIVRLDVWLAGALLGPSQAGVLADRVETLTHSRAGVVDAADAERRRIERDLHDGAQQRLIALALHLGLAREQLTGLTPEARMVIDEAHEEAKRAVAELRNLVRGLHPAILEDRGLDAALSGIAALAPFPVRLRVDVPHRPAAAVEAIAYFVVSEALTNAARHAGASRADVTVERRGDLLRVSVTDDGRGGADASRGTGLTGLASRAAAVDGSFRCYSPAGGPTTIIAELPCGR